MMRHVWNVFAKERMDTLRDRRTVAAALAYAFFGPAVLVLVLTYIADVRKDEAKTTLAFENAAAAPEIAEYLAGQNIEVTSVEKMPSLEDAIGKNQVLLVLEDDYQQKIAEGKPAKVYLYVDRTNNRASARASEVRRHLAAYASQLDQLRLLGAGVPPSFAISHAIEIRDLSIAGAVAKQISFMLIYFFVLAPFFSSLGVAIDVTAGERERRSLQSLLAQPVRPMDLILGKWMLAAGFGMVGTAITVVAGMTALTFTPLDVLGVRFNLGVSHQLAMLGALLPLALFVSAFQVLISLAAKSYREANTYLQLTAFAPIAIGLTMSLTGNTFEGPAAWLPILSQLQSAQDILVKGHLVTPVILVSSALAAALAALLLWVAAKRLASEKILTAA